MWFVLEISVRVTLAALAVALLLRLLRIRTAAVRHSAWTVVLGAMLLMPLLPSVVPALPIPVPTRVAPPAATPLFVEERVVPLPPPVTPRIVAPAPGQVIHTAPPAAPAQPRRDWLPLAVTMVYGSGVLLFFTRLLYGWWIGSAMIRRARPTERDRVFESPEVAVPLTAGTARPVVILPTGWQAWPREKFDAVLAHEMAHVERRDPLVAFLARLNRALFWFHPLAWWLERQLAVTAEHACDEAAARVVAEPRRYAEILLEMAEAVRAHRGRIVWQGVGVDGGGVLQGRIDRVLRGVSSTPMTRARKIAALVACGAVILLVVACRQKAMEPLQPDPELSQQLAEEDARMKKFETVRTMTVQDADALEQKLAANPQDFDTRERLTWYYTTQKVPWENKLAGLRRHALWLIEHAPEHEVSPPRISRQYDPEGFAAAKALWERHLSKSDASPFLVYRAASFFSAQDKPYAEQLILRGMQRDPDSAALKARMRPNVGGYQWRSQLADLYASALIGSESVWGTYNDLRSRPEWMNSAFAQEVRQKIDASTDAGLLASIGSRLTRRDHPDEIKNLGIKYLNRGLEIDPQQTVAKTTLVRLTLKENETDLDRAAEKAHMTLVGADSTDYYKRDAAAARQQRAEAKAQAEEVLKAAASKAGDPSASAAVMTAHQVIAAVALTEGNRESAVRHLLDSVKVPASDRTQYAMTPAFSRPVNKLLQEGERERIVEFYEGLAQLSVVDRQYYLDAASAIREGRMPLSYQRMVNREWNEKNRPETRKTVSGS